MLVFDREEYSPDLFYDLWQKRIYIPTYKKNVSDKWDEAEFAEYTGKLPSGNEKTYDARIWNRHTCKLYVRKNQ